MPNPHSVYLHDTNNRSLFGGDYRFQSSGCARIENPRDLAVWLLQGQGDWSRAQIDAAIATGQRQDIRLTRKVPVAWIYLTGWVTRDNVVHFRDDIYNHDTAPSRALVADLGARERPARLRLHPAVRRSRAGPAGLVSRQPIGRSDVHRCRGRRSLRSPPFFGAILKRLPKQ